MRLRTLGVLFVLGLVGTGVAIAGANGNWSVHPTGEFEVPARDTKAHGQAIIRLAQDEQSLEFRLNATNIDNVIAAHIHIGAPNQNGPVVAFLYGNVPPGGGPQNGTLSSGTITAANLVGPLLGQPFSALVAELKRGNAYVNVHTNDGVDPANTGPGDFPGGEIRHQLPAD